jgi:ABC-type Mn2+/Zn2+ transport system permease subunit
MKNVASTIVQNPAARAFVMVLLVAPISAYLGTSTVRRGILYYLEVFAPAVVLGIAIGLWSWSLRWFWSALAIGVAVTVLTQGIAYLFLR